MTVSPLVWTLTIAGIAALLLSDFFVHVRKAHVHDERVRSTT
jgi:tellurite resistance protein TerC